MNSLGQKIAALLHENGITQRELAENIGVTEASMSRYIRDDRVPKAEVIANIATALHTTSDYLLNTEERSDFEKEFPQIKRLIARNANLMTSQQKKALINALFGDESE